MDRNPAPTSRLGQYELALRDLTEAIRQIPNYGEAYYERSLVYKRIGRKVLSENDLQTATKLGCQRPKEMK